MSYISGEGRQVLQDPIIYILHEKWLVVAKPQLAVVAPIGCSDLLVYFLTVSSLSRYNTLVNLYFDGVLKVLTTRI